MSRSCRAARWSRPTPFSWLADKPAIPGVGAAVAEKLERLGLRREADLVFHLPLRYEDETRLTAIRDALPTFSPTECANYFTATGYEPE